MSSLGEEKGREERRISRRASIPLHVSSEACWLGVGPRTRHRTQGQRTLHLTPHGSPSRMVRMGPMPGQLQPPLWSSTWEIARELPVQEKGMVETAVDRGSRISCACSVFTRLHGYGSRRLAPQGRTHKMNPVPLKSSAEQPILCGRPTHTPG